MEPFQHALVVGGTGMLRDVVKELGKALPVVSVVARDSKTLDTVGEQLLSSTVRYNPIPVDYTKSAAWNLALTQTIERYGPIDLVVAWIHETAPEAALHLARLVAQHSSNTTYFHVLGSDAADPLREKLPTELLMEEISNLTYRRIILGFMTAGGNSRWLTHEEISHGIMRAISKCAREYIVGSVRPWEKRPEVSL